MYPGAHYFGAAIHAEMINNFSSIVHFFLCNWLKLHAGRIAWIAKVDKTGENMLWFFLHARY